MLFLIIDGERWSLSAHPLVHRLFHHPKPHAHRLEGTYCLVQILSCTCRRDLHLNPGLSFRGHGVAEPDYLDTFFYELGCHILGELCIGEHNENDGVHTGPDLEAPCGHLIPEIAGILLQAIPLLGCL
jgi:hypothetical protein